MSKRIGLAGRVAVGAGIWAALAGCANNGKPTPGGDVESGTSGTGTAQPQSGDSATPTQLPAPIATGSGQVLSTSTGDFSLTIYSSADPASFSPQDLLQQQTAGGQSSQYVNAPGYGMVREIRKMNLSTGTTRVEFPDVAAGIDPTTVSFTSLTAPATTSVLEQNFEFDLSSADKLLHKYIGRQVVITPRQSAAVDAGKDVRGRLLSSIGGTYVVATDDKKTPIVLQQSSEVSAVRFADLDTGLVSKPTLTWKLSAQQAGEHKVQVTYQTDGLTWRADYNVVMSADEKTADISSWVTALNASGIAYPNAKLKLVAGNVHRHMPQQQHGLFEASDEARTTAYSGFNEKAFFEYHLYTLDRATTLANNSTKQIELFPPRSAVPVSKNYVYYGTPENARNAIFPEPQKEQNFGSTGKSEVDIYVKFHNGRDQHLGIPLPAGRVRTYKVDLADGNREFIGEDVIPHTPMDEDVLVRLGAAFDIVGERRQTDFKEGERSIAESFEIKIRNHKADAAHVIVKENLYRWANWDITGSSDKFEKQDYRTIYIPVDVPANGEKVLTYSVKYSW